jgi:PAS domain S-box-containing protein
LEPGIRGTVAPASKGGLGSVRKYTALAAIALAGIGVVELALYLVHRETRRWVLHSRTVRAASRQANILVLERAVSIRGFLITRDSESLAPELSARVALPLTLDSLVTLTADNPPQQRRAEDIRRAIAEWDSAFAQPALRGARASALDRLAGKLLFDRIRQRLGEFVAIEDALYPERLKRDEIIEFFAMMGVVFPLVLLAGVFVLMGHRVASQANSLLDQQAQLEEQAIELEQQVAELETTNQELAEAMTAGDAARAKAELEQSERERAFALLDASLQSAPVGFAFFDQDLRYVRANPVIAELAERPEKDLIGRTVREIASPHLVDALEASMRRVLETGQPLADVRVTTERPLGSGKRRELVLNYYPLRPRDGATAGIGLVVVEITQLVQLEEQVRQSQKMEAVGRLAGGVAHDFNNLLTVIRSYCDLVLLEMSETDPRREELLEIGGAADRAAALARQLLAFSRKEVMLPRVFDLNEVVKSLEAMLARTLPAAVKPSLRLSTGLGAMKADPGQIEQVLMNLAINAADAMPNGGQLAIETANATLDALYAKQHAGVVPGDYVMFSVSDTGTGMDAQTLERVFEPFFTTKPAGKGTGLGLSTVYAITKQNGGHIWVYSEPGQGTTFKVYFPLVHEEVSGPQRLRTGTPPEKRATETVLVVEDEPSVRTSLTRILERQGYTVLGASHGGEAMRISSEHRGAIDLVISDLMMPEMSGREFIDRFSAARPDSHVLFMSGYTDDDVQLRGLVEARQAFIEKPFTVEQITLKVRQVLEHA